MHVLNFFKEKLIMARPFVIPDPRDRSPNSPTIIVSCIQVLGFYNQENSHDTKSRVVEKVQDFFKEKAENLGWHKATFHGNQCLLEVNVQIIN
jgi:hypothetical protein